MYQRYRKCKYISNIVVWEFVWRGFLSLNKIMGLESNFYFSFNIAHLPFGLQGKGKNLILMLKAIPGIGATFLF